MTRDERRKPELGALEKHYLAELDALGNSTGNYNLPDWDNDPRSFHARLATLFPHSPPTAVLFEEPMLFAGAQSFFTQHGLRVPDDVSTIVPDRHPSFSWYDPLPTHLNTEPIRWVSQVMRWVENVARGKNNRRKTVVKAGIAEGGTIATSPGK